MTKPPPNVSIFWDNSNIYVPAIDAARERDGAIVGRSLRIHFLNLFELARAGRRVVGGFCVGTTSFRNVKLEQRLQEVGVEIEFFERGRDTGGEQAVDQALQVHMLRSLCDMPPGIAVLMTGDGAGAGTGRGYMADLQRMHRAGWQIEQPAIAACSPGQSKWVTSSRSMTTTSTSPSLKACDSLETWAGYPGPSRRRPLPRRRFDRRERPLGTQRGLCWVRNSMSATRPFTSEPSGASRQCLSR